MKISEIAKEFFIKIAKKLGLELQKKSETKSFYSDMGFNPTAIGANVVASIAIDDSEIIIDGNNKRADAIREMVDYFVEDIEDIAAEVSLGTGDCIVRPYTDGKNIGLNVIGNNDFIVTESIGTRLKGVIMKIDEYSADTKTYRLFESQSLKDTENGSVVYIRRFAYLNDNETDIRSTNWKGISPEDTVLSEQLLLGRYKCPTINRENYNSANGVPITFGFDTIIENVKKKYAQFNDEFDRKQAVTFIDRTLVREDSDGKAPKKYKMDGHEFINTTGNLNDGISSMIQDYSPDIRSADFQLGEDFNLAVLELCCGFSRGVFTKPETSFATATEMKNSLKKTFSFVKKFRRKIESGNKMLFKAIDIIMNLNGTTPLGDWEIRHEWSYDYIEQTQEKFNQLIQAHSIGAVKTSDVTAWVLDMSQEEAELYVSEISEETETEEPDSIDGDGFNNTENGGNKDE